MRDVILLFVGFGFGYWYAWRRFRIGNVKDAWQDKILGLMRDRGELTNNDVEKVLDVSDATATRYLDKLERAGKIIQIGQEGRFVKYRLR